MSPDMPNNQISSTVDIIFSSYVVHKMYICLISLNEIFFLACSRYLWLIQISLAVPVGADLAVSSLSEPHSTQRAAVLATAFLLFNLFDMIIHVTQSALSDKDISRNAQSYMGS